MIVTGGIGLAPLRPAILEVVSRRAEYGRVVLLYGARSPEDILFAEDMATWAADHDIVVEVTVDYGPPSWTGRVGLVTNLVARAGFDPLHTLALVCGPEVMMRYAATALIARGVRPEPHPAVDGAQHEVRRRPVRALPAARAVPLRGRSGARLRPARPSDGRPGAVMTESPSAVRRAEDARGRPPARPWPCGSSPPATAAS